MSLFLRQTATSSRDQCLNKRERLLPCMMHGTHDEFIFLKTGGETREGDHDAGSHDGHDPPAGCACHDGGGGMTLGVMRGYDPLPTEELEMYHNIDQYEY